MTVIFWNFFQSWRFLPVFYSQVLCDAHFCTREVFDAFLIFCSGQIVGSEITGSEGTHVFKTLDTSLATLLSRKAVPGLGSFILYPLCLSRPCCASEPRVSAVGRVKRDLEQLPVHSFPEPNLDEEEQSKCDSYLSVAGESSFFPPTFPNQMRTCIGEPYLNPGF